MPVIAALTGSLPKAGVIVVGLVAAAALVARTPRARATAYLAALLLAPALLLADIWTSPQLRLVHRHPLVAAAAAAAVLALVAGLAVAVSRRPRLLAPLAVAALPFRIPIEAGGSTSNLLVPLYLVVAAGSLAFLVPALRERRHSEGQRALAPGGLHRLLAIYIVLYGLQAVYSTDFEKALQQMVFFYAPFALLFGLLSELDWTPRVIRTCFTVVVGLAIVFAGIGFYEYATKTILLNPKLVVANSLHTYFTVNSVFFDPDIFGRFLAVVMVGLAALLVFEGRFGDAQDDPRTRAQRLMATVVALAVLWCGLVLTLSRSSLGALLVGLATLAALRWRITRVLALALAVIALGALAVAVTPKTFGLNQGANGASSGRADLVTGGATLFADRPIWGYGSGSFVHEYRLRHHGSAQTLSASHTIPITIAVEQGMIGEIAYLALVITALVTLLRGTRADPVRAAVGAAFVALVFHTLLYADFLEDPFTWALLAVGYALARAPARAGPALATESPQPRDATVTA